MADSLSEDDVRRISGALELERLKTKTELERRINQSKKRLGGGGMSSRGWSRFRQLFIDRFVSRLPETVEIKFERTSKLGKVYTQVVLRNPRTGRFMRR